MKKLLEILKFVFLLGIIVFLFSFSKKRNDKREISGVEIQFSELNAPFITHEIVNKLLIQNEEADQELRKEALDLRLMEQRLTENPMVRKAEVFVTVDGILNAEIEQRDPIGRAHSVSGEIFYIDADGLKMPLSSTYSARVPLVSGIAEEDIESLSSLLLKIREDEFMKKMIIGMDKEPNGDYIFSFREIPIRANFGKINHIDKKFQNLKFFYKKTVQDSTIYQYDMINLKFENQVIAEKKVK